jgi:AraC-like DNA-binding protein
MLFFDLVSSISHALPSLVATSMRRGAAETTLDARTGHAFFCPPAADAHENPALDEPATWRRLQGSRLGILGSEAVGAVVARVARERHAAEVLYHASASPDDRGLDAYATYANGGSLTEVLSAHVLCVALPWPSRLLEQAQANKPIEVDAERVLVAWRRAPAIERALVYMGEHYVESIQLRDLAAAACMSKCHLVRRFTATLGMSPHRYQLLLRLSRAKMMLREGGGITHIAQRVGFFDHSHLDRSFRALLGMTPTQYQRSVGQGATSS